MLFYLPFFNHSQKEITQKIISKEADYVLGLKGNHPLLHGAVEEHFMYELSPYETVYTEEMNGSRLEKREYYLETDINFLKDVPEIDKWVGLNAVGMVKSVIERGGEPSFEVRYFITSLSDVNEFAYAVRQHWSIENHLHWRLDVIFREDSLKVKKGNAPLNMHILRAKSLFLLKNANMRKKISMRKLRYLASLDTNILERIFFGVPSYNS